MKAKEYQGKIEKEYENGDNGKKSKIVKNKECPSCNGNGYIALDPKKKDLYKSEENFISCSICTLDGARTADSGPVSVNLH